MKRFLWMVVMSACAAKPAPVNAPSSAAPSSAAPVAAATPPAAAEPSGPVRATLAVEAVTKSGQHLVTPGETLHTGDRIALRVEVDRPAYVYVVQAAPGTPQPSVLYPPKDDELFQPGGAVRIPPVGQWLRLDKEI